MSLLNLGGNSLFQSGQSNWPGLTTRQVNTTAAQCIKNRLISQAQETTVKDLDPVVPYANTDVMLGAMGNKGLDTSALKNKIQALKGKGKKPTLLILDTSLHGQRTLKAAQDQIKQLGLTGQIDVCVLDQSQFGGNFNAAAEGVKQYIQNHEEVVALNISNGPEMKKTELGLTSWDQWQTYKDRTLQQSPYANGIQTVDQLAQQLLVTIPIGNYNQISLLAGNPHVVSVATTGNNNQLMPLNVPVQTDVKINGTVNVQSEQNATSFAAPKAAIVGIAALMGQN